MISFSFISLRYELALIVLTGFTLALVVSCTPAAMKAVDDPRDGAPLCNRVAIVYSKNYQISLGGFEKLHPFDINKYATIYLQLVADGLITPDQVFVPEEIGTEDLLRVHTKAYLEDLKDKAKVARYIEASQLRLLPMFMIESGVLKPFRIATAGTVLAARQALNSGIAINIGGGYHHAEPGRGGGFCIYSDMPIAIRVLQSEKLIKRALVIDLDAHQGNGTAESLADDDTTFTFSMHEGNIYPFPKATSDLDIELDAGAGDEEVHALLKKHLPMILDWSKPDIVFLQAGCDTLTDDPLTNLCMTLEGIVARDAMVIDECVKRKIPIVMTLGGGYSKQAWRVQYESIKRTIKTYAPPPTVER